MLPGNVNFLSYSGEEQRITITDLGILAANWQQAEINGDLNGDNSVSLTDLAILAANWQQPLSSPTPKSALQNRVAHGPMAEPSTAKHVRRQSDNQLERQLETQVSPYYEPESQGREAISTIHHQEVIPDYSASGNSKSEKPKTEATGLTDDVLWPDAVDATLSE